jgi:hypothetical protein
MIMIIDKEVPELFNMKTKKLENKTVFITGGYRVSGKSVL